MYKSKNNKPKYRKNNQVNHKSVQIKSRVPISPSYVQSVKDFFQCIPRFEKLDSLSIPVSTLYDKLIESYFENANFKKHPKLSNPHHLLTLRDGMKRVYGRSNILFCIDVEAWEFNQKLVTEIGISIFDPRGQLYAMYPDILQIHIMIRENIENKNGRFVPDHSRNFNGGVTYVMNQEDAVLFTQSLVDYYFFKPKGIDCCLAGHNVGGDITWLQDLGITFPEKFNHIDTQTLFSLSHGLNGSSLKNALRTVNLPHAFLHNAGNDAYFTLLLAMKLCDPNARTLHCLDDTKGVLKAAATSGAPRAGESITKRSKRIKIQHQNTSQFVDIGDVREILTRLFVDGEDSSNDDDDDKEEI